MQARTQLDKHGFLAAVGKELDGRRGDFPDAVERVLAKHPVDPALADEAMTLGLVEIAREEWGTAERQRILRTVRVVGNQVPGTSRIVSVTVVRSALRDWPVLTVAGYRRMEDCSVDDIRRSVEHLTSTMEGLERQRAVQQAVIDAALEAGVSRIGDLPDDVMDRCLEMGV